MRNRCSGMVKTFKKEFSRVILERFQKAVLDYSKDNKGSDEIKEEVPFKVEESLNLPYMNRREILLAMDVFKPVTEKGMKLPVIVNVRGSGQVTDDLKITRDFDRILAGYGYLVFSIEFRQAPRANCEEQLDDVCAGMDLIDREIVNYDVDFSRIFLVTESAGAYLATCLTAMQGSENLQNAIGYKPSKTVFTALGLICGMFYTQKRDPIGMFMSDLFYADMEKSDLFVKYADPGNPEILNNLPPVYLITSRGDFLNNHTLMFHDALKKKEKRTHLLYFGDSKLLHSFVTVHPNHKKSREALDKMLAWFEEEADNARSTDVPSESRTNEPKNKKMEPVKKQPVKKEPVKKAAVKKQPVKQATVKKAPVKKATVKQAPNKKEPVKQEVNTTGRGRKKKDPT